MKILALDTEGYRGAVWGLSYALDHGEGIVVRADDAEGLKAVQWALHGADRIVLHHALHDLPILRELGLDVEDTKLYDTMVAAYLLGLEPQGLKALAYRHLGMRMGDYQDLTAVSSERVAREWLFKLWDSLPVPIPPKSRQKKGVEYPIPTEDELYAMRARTLIERMMTKDGPIRARWNNKKCAARVILEDELGTIDPMPLPTLDDVIADCGGDETAVVEYAGADADATRRLDPILDAEIDAYGLRDVCDTTIGIIPMIDRMQSIGMKVNLDHFAALLPILDGRAQELDAELRALGAPDGFNANSGDQVAALLFDKLYLHKKAPNLRLKKTEGGRFSTDDKGLEALEGVHPIVRAIRMRRECTTLRSRYVLTVPKLVAADGRLHPELLLTRTGTGRLAAKNPNLLAFPKWSEWGKLIRYGFVADDGHEYGAWDMDQIEMRVFADNAEEVNMLLAFAAGIDLHATTAALIFGRPADVILGEHKAHEGKGGEQRFAAKAVNFGTLMGITPFGLLDQFHKNKQLHWTLDDCEKLLADWRTAYPSGAAWIKARHEEARRYSYVRDMFGRLRWLDGVHSDDPYIRAEAERAAQATPIQSGAQGIMQRAMKNAWPDICRLRQSFWVEPLLQIHDDLMFEYDVRQRAEMNTLILGHMANAVTLKVPVTAKGSYGANWGEVS